MEAAVDFVAELGVGVVVRCEVGGGRFGGMPFLRGDLTVDLWSSAVGRPLLLVGALSSPESALVKRSSVGASPVASSMIEDVRVHDMNLNDEGC